jgi:S1-C subfamily serine protease
MKNAVRQFNSRNRASPNVIIRQTRRRKSGFQKDDVIVQIAGQSKRMTESELIGRLLQNHQVGENVKTTVLRGNERVELSLPMQNCSIITR